MAPKLSAATRPLPVAELARLTAPERARHYAAIGLDHLERFEAEQRVRREIRRAAR